MAFNVTYSNHYVWNQTRQGAPQDNRPYAEVVLTGQTSVRIWCLVDSGADRIQLNQSFANNVGIALPATTQQVQTASGGNTNVYSVSNVSLSIEGKNISDTCLFGNNTTPILGRVTFLNAFKVGFDKQGWLA